MLALLGTTVQADDMDTIEYRQNIMKTLGEQMSLLGMMLEKRAPADDFAAHAKILALTASTVEVAFEPEVEGGRAKSTVWAQWPDFQKRLAAFTTAAQELAKTADSGGMQAAAGKMQTLQCKACHDSYREPAS